MDLRYSRASTRKIDLVDRDGGYWCVECGRFLELQEDGHIHHDDVPHTTLGMLYDDDANPQ